jgi:drug/metabolite transporter (DMT)-like permease
MNIIFLLIGLSSGFAHSIYSAFSKSLLKNRIREPFLLFLYVNALQALLTPLFWLVIQPKLPAPGGWMPLLTSCVTCVIAYCFLYTALHYGDASSVMPIMGSKVIFAGLLAVPMLGETHTWQVYIAVVIVAIAIAILGYSPSETGHTRFPPLPIFLMTTGCVIFGFTDIFIKRALSYVDAFNFMIYYNFFVGALSFCVIPYLKKRKVSLVLKGMDLKLSIYAAIAIVAATLLYVVLLEMGNGVVIPNILQSTRGIFIVLISAFLTHRGSTLLETQTRKVYVLRLAASFLIIISIWIALSHFPGDS